MNIAQIAFILALMIIGRYLLNRDNKLVSRILIILFLFLGLIGITKPNWTSAVAHWIGIGRGTDLIFYLYIFFSIFVFGYLRNKINGLFRSLTKLTREIAIMNAKVPDKVQVEDHDENNIENKEYNSR